MPEPIYAIGDIHGQLSNLLDLHKLIATDRDEYGNPNAEVVHVGDLVDRGPNSCGVIDYLMAGQNAGQPWVILKGNHDRLFYKFMDDPHWHDPRLRPDYSWLHRNMGGMDTLRSYGVEVSAQQDVLAIWSAAKSNVPKAHLDFLKSCPTYYRSGDFFFAHAGIRPGVSLDQQTEDDLIWIRQEFHVDPGWHGALIIHGHTPVDHATHYGNRVNIDSGAGFGRAMTAVVIEGNEVCALNSKGRQRLEPVTA